MLLSFELNKILLRFRGHDIPVSMCSQLSHWQRPSQGKCILALSCAADLLLCIVFVDVTRERKKEEDGYPDMGKYMH